MDGGYFYLVTFVRELTDEERACYPQRNVNYGDSVFQFKNHPPRAAEVWSARSTIAKSCNVNTEDVIFTGLYRLNDESRLDYNLK